jgi:iron(III) transport system substrate-binding protein
MHSIFKVPHIRRLVLALALLATALPGLAQDASLALYDGPDRAQKIIAAAKKEGSVSLYTTLAANNLRALIGPFEEKYGIKVTIWRASTSKVLQRTVTEAAAGRYEVDAIHFGSPQLEALYREKILQPVNSPVLRELGAGEVPDHHGWAATILQIYVQAYNTNLIKKEDLPKTYQDLLDPKWKGKLGIENEAWPWYARLAKEMGEEKSAKLFRDIVATNGMSAHRGETSLNNLVIAGDVPLALTDYQHIAQSSKKKGAPIDWFALKPTIARANGIGIARHAPHPNAALLFYEYMLSADGAQKVFARLGYVPTNTKQTSESAKDLRVVQVEPAVVLDEVNKWSRAFEEVFLKHGERADAAPAPAPQR